MKQGVYVVSSQRRTGMDGTRYIIEHVRYQHYGYRIVRDGKVVAEVARLIDVNQILTEVGK